MKELTKAEERLADFKKENIGVMPDEKGGMREIIVVGAVIIVCKKRSEITKISINFGLSLCLKSQKT